MWPKYSKHQTSKWETQVWFLLLLLSPIPSSQFQIMSLSPTPLTYFRVIRFLTRAITVVTWLVSLPLIHLPPSATMMVLTALLTGKPGELPHLPVKPSLEPGISHVFDFPPPTCHCWSLPLYSVSMHNYHLWFHRHVGASQVAQW